MSNKYAGKCTTCGATVAPGEGELTKVDGKFTVAHASQAACQAAYLAAAAAPVVAPKAPVTEVGMYALGEEFYKVQAGQRGQLYAKRVAVATTWDGKVRVRFVYAPGVVAKLAPADKLTAAQAREFGMNFGTCVNCGLLLHDKEGRSQLAGYGKKCAERNGWWYPSAAEVRAAAVAA